MASADLQKHLGKTACCGISRHNYRDGRNHSNKDIDPSRSHLNKHYGPQTSAEFRAMYHEMVRDFDSRIPPKRKKQDRKTSMGINIPSPREGMTPEQEAAWSEAAYHKIEQLFPGQVVGGTYHADEVHKYIADGQERVSRGHTHVEVIPWVDGKGLNMDAFYKRSLPNKINAALDEVCMEMFGFPFRDGSQAKSRGRVEKLKAESAKEERLQEEAQLEQVQMQVLDAQGAIFDKQADLQELEQKVAAAEQQKVVAEQETAEIRTALEQLQGAVQRLFVQLQQLKPKEREKEKDLFAWMEKHGKVMGGGKDLAEIRTTTAHISQESSRIAEQYLAPPEEPEDWEYC